MTTWTRHHRGDCPACQGERKDCRTNNDTGITHCRRSGPPEPPGLQFIGEDSLGFGMYAPNDGQQNPADFERWQWEREARRLEEQAQRAKSLPPVELDRGYRQLLGMLSLHPEDRDDLHRRGFTDQQIEEQGFKSVERWQRLDRELWPDLPGVSADGQSLNVPYPGYLCPIFNMGFFT